MPVEHGGKGDPASPRPRFVRVDGRPVAQGVGRGGIEIWDFLDEEQVVYARAEVLRGDEQWGVRLQDRAPHLADSDLLRRVGELLIWHLGCEVETVDVVLGRTHAHHMLVRVGGEYL